MRGRLFCPRLIKYFESVKRITIIIASLACLPMMVQAQYAWQEGEEAGKLRLDENLQGLLEVQASCSDGHTPLWLNANKYGLSSLSQTNGYIRRSVIRPLSTDSARRWGIGYGIDWARALHYTSHAVLQQAFVEARWLHGVLTVGAKQYPMEMKNQRLSSGSQTFGINARPVPQVRLALPEYWTLPVLHHWLHLKGHVAYGRMTDDGWQHTFTQRQSKYADDVLYHSKAGYLKIGNEEAFFPLSLELGLEMATEFGGTPYRIVNGTPTPIPAGHGLKDFWDAFVPGGSDYGEGEYANVAGNSVGSWLFRLNYDADAWRLGFYGDHFFEDHSQMFLLDYDGYPGGENWNEHKYRRFYRYKLKDIMLGWELNLKYGRWIRDVVVEYLYTKYQSGAIYHDRTQNIPDHLAGKDDYYNHGLYTGWQHWGQVMGNPLYRSPIYNEDGSICVKNNRFVAWHLGIDGSPMPHLDYRLLASCQRGWGTYKDPFTHPHRNISWMLEATYHLPKRWSVTGAYGMDIGSGEMLGDNQGFQLTLRKEGIIHLTTKNRKGKK